MEIDDKFLDVDFEKDPNYTFGSLEIPSFINFAAYEDTAVKVLTASEIREQVEKNAATGGGGSRLVTRIYNQGREGSCVANACCQANEMIQAMQFGKANVVPLAAITLYDRIGRSASSGAMVSDGLDEMMEGGVLPLDTPENRAKFGDHVKPNTGFKKPYPSGWQATAKKFAGIEAHVVRTIEGLQTALVNHLPVVVGRQGHSICLADLILRNGSLVAPYPNSWNVTWGSPYAEMPGGFGFDSISQMKQSARWAFVLRAVTVRT